MTQFRYFLKPARLELVTGSSTLGRIRKGLMILMGLRQNNDESKFGKCIFEAEDESAARKIMGADPAVAGGVMRATLYHIKLRLCAVKPNKGVYCAYDPL